MTGGDDALRRTIDVELIEFGVKFEPLVDQYYPAHRRWSAALAQAHAEHHREFGDPKKGDYARPEISSAFMGSCERTHAGGSPAKTGKSCTAVATQSVRAAISGADQFGDAWDESHDPDGPLRCFGGEDTGVAHRACTRRQGAEVVRPMDAKATRNRQKHIGAFQTRHKLPGGRTDWRKRKLNGEVVLGPMSLLCPVFVPCL
jgi:hypothetical protein